tara:strand:+ start:4047 stop:4631 length:585 start_codon:yes stop_codon:yes gene_type:complete
VSISFSSVPTLLLIDIQKGLDQWNYYGGNRNNPDAELNMANILQYWRSNNWPLYHIKHNSTSVNSPLFPGQIGNEFKDEVMPVKGEIVIEKNVNSAFIGTDLLEKLIQAKANELVIIGLTTDYCVSSTTRMAGNLGFEVKLISDATATFDKRGQNGKKYGAEDIHNIELAILLEEFCKVCSTKELLNGLNGNSF